MTASGHAPLDNSSVQTCSSGRPYPNSAVKEYAAPGSASGRSAPQVGRELRIWLNNSYVSRAATSASRVAASMRIDAATREAEVAARETYELFNQIRNSLPTWGALLPEADPGAAYSLTALFGYGLPEEHVWTEELSSGAWPLAVIASERGETLLISAWAQNPADPATVCAYMRTALERLAETLETAPDTLAASID